MNDLKDTNVSFSPSYTQCNLALLYFPLKQFSHRFGDNIFTVGNN